MIHFLVDMDDLTRIESALGMMKDKSAIVLRTAINNTAKQMEKLTVNEANAKYKVQGRKSELHSANTITKAKTSSMSAVIMAKGPAKELIDFDVKPRTYYPGSKGAPKWIKARGRRDSKYTKLARHPNSTGDKYKGFIVQYRSGHLAVAERVPGKKMKKKPYREAIESLYSISIPKMEEVVYRDEISDDMEPILMQNIQAQILRYLQ